MCLIARIRVLITTIVLASYSPLGHAIGLGDAELGRAGHLAISMFVGRRTRVAASQQFEVSSREICYSPVTGGSSSTHTLRNGI